MGNPGPPDAHSICSTKYFKLRRMSTAGARGRTSLDWDANQASRAPWLVTRPRKNATYFQLPTADSSSRPDRDVYRTYADRRG